MPPRTKVSSAFSPTNPSAASDELAVLVPSWELALRAENRSPATITGYLNALTTFRTYLLREGLPCTLTQITREHCKAFIDDQLRHHKAATAATRYRNLGQFFRWCVDEGEIQVSPMRGMKQPALGDSPPEVLSVEDVRQLLHACRGNDFLARRDTAIIRVLVDSGMRRAELANLRLDDIDWTEGTLRVVGKGNRVRLCSFGKKAARDLNRYVRVRALHRHAETEWLWLGHSGKGPKLCDESIYQMVRRRAKQAGIGKAWTHLFRHTFAHLFLDAGGQEGQLMSLGGWRDYATMQRYGRSAAASRARDAHKLLSPGDRV